VTKAASPDTQIVVAEPSVAALLTSGKEQDRAADGSSASTHPAFCGRWW
jgi:hypothetical protein